MRWGLDAATPPDAATLEFWYGLGWDWIAGYVGGKAFHTWTADEWQRVRSAGFELLPIWVAPLAEDAGREAGVQHGNECLQALQEQGLSGVVALDVENGLAPAAYAGGFVDAVHAGECQVLLYGSAGTLHALTDVGFDFWWLAEWSPDRRQMYAAPPDFTLWQFASGPQADYSIAADGFTFATLTLSDSPSAPSGPPTAEA